jgi:hypothetical protein
MQATLVVVVSALLSLILPPLSYLSGAAVALVTLRMGLQQGLLLILGAAVAVGLFGLLVLQNPAAGVVFGFALWLPVWGMAVSLRRTARPARSLILAMLFGVMAVLAFHLGTDNPAQWWYGTLQDTLKQTINQLTEAERTQLLENLKVIANLMTGVSAAALSASLIGCLMLGRWWQAALYNPGGFGGEFRRIRLGRPLSLIALVMVGVSSLAGAQLVYQDMVVVLMVPFTVQGLAVIHAVAKQRNAHYGWLAGMYILLFIATGQMVLLLAFAGAVDNWFDFRSFVGPKSGPGDR